ncbi:MAG: hypothetical protein PHZ00_06580 [Candidatus Peribacteraceae bacterium]|nr:hypothetical protein [Candidatus Peribacteraceae bacterium]
MKTTSSIIGITVAFVLLSAAAMAAVPSAAAYRGDPSVQGPEYSAERHTAMTAAFASGDYKAWKNLMGDRGATRKVNEGNFSRFAEANALAKSGNLEGAKAIRAELGLGLGQGQGQGRKQGGGGRLADGTGSGPRNGTGPRSMNGECTVSR